MRLYLGVAVLTFVGSLGAYSGSQMLGAARAVGGGQSGSAATTFARNFNPFYLLQGDRLRALMSSSAGAPRAQPFRPRFDGPSAIRSWRAPIISPDLGRKIYISPPQIRVPHIHTPPPVRIYR